MGTNACLAVDSSTVNTGIFQASGSKTSYPSKRTVFRVIKAKSSSTPKDTNDEDDIIRFGDEVSLVTSAQLFGKAHAQLSSSSSFSIGKNQACFAFGNSQAQNRWQVLSTKFENRYKGIEEPVHAMQPFILKHCGNGQWLGMRPKALATPFGRECEVFVQTFEVRHKSYKVHNEVLENALKPFAKDCPDENYWCFKGAQ